MGTSWSVLHSCIHFLRSKNKNKNLQGVVILTQGYLIFEPLRQDLLVRKHGADKYRWWIRVPFLERWGVLSFFFQMFLLLICSFPNSCKIMEDSTDIEDKNSDDFVVLNQQVESEHQPEIKGSWYQEDSGVLGRRFSSGDSDQHRSASTSSQIGGNDVSEEEESASVGLPFFFFFFFFHPKVTVFMTIIRHQEDLNQTLSFRALSTGLM